MIESFGDRLRNSRKSVNVTLREINERDPSLDLATLSKYERGKKLPSFFKLRAIARAYRVSSDYLLGIKQEKS